MIALKWDRTERS